MSGLLSNPASLRVALFAVAILALSVAYLSHRIRSVRRRQRILRETHSELTAPSPDLPEGTSPEESAGHEPADSPPRAAEDEAWQGVLPAASSLGSRVSRGILVLLATVVALGFILILLPEGTLRSIIQTLQASRAAELPPERIALLFLGDEVRERDFHIRGILRNISSEPLNKLDAAIRLYSPENVLLETVVVRMDAETIPADGTTEFHLVYPGYTGQFGSYSVDFKLRQGERVPYKDRRGERHSK